MASESVINDLEYRGLDRGAERMIGLAVLAGNAQRVGRILCDRESERLNARPFLLAA